jgi:cytoskeletal protein CcmA (bactofilin family)
MTGFFVEDGVEAPNATQIDKQADFEGKLSGKDARVLGKFRGEIQLQGRLIVGEESRVEAKVKADAAEIGGEFKGDISVRSLVLLEKARVEGTIEAQVLSVREGAQVNASVNAGAGASASTGAARATVAT